MGFLGLKFEYLFLANGGRSHLLSTSQISNTEQTFFSSCTSTSTHCGECVCERERGENRAIRAHIHRTIVSTA